MDAIAAAQEQMLRDRLRNKLNEVQSAAQTQFSGIQHHVNFTLQQASFKCAYECFDTRRKTEEISDCVERCGFPVTNAQQLVENEMRQFQERMQRSMAVCQDKYEISKLQPGKTGGMSDLESCIDQTIKDSVSSLPGVVPKLKTSLNIRDQARKN